MGTRSVLINLLGEGGGASRALRGVGDDADHAARRVDDLDRSSGLLTRGLSALAPAAGKAAASIGMTAAQFGAAVPAAAAVATTLVNIAPAAGVAATALVAAGLASTALKIGMSGVNEAVTAALDPTQAEAFAEALKKLSPNARAFALEVKALSPELAKIKTAVQDRLFENLGASLKTTATETLPIFRRGLVGAADALNGMAFGVMASVRSLAKGGALGTAVDSATGGLKNLSQIPAQIVLGLGQVAAAAGPTFQRMAAGIAGGVTAISEKLSGAFKSGAMEKAINGAVALLKELVTVGANVGKILGNILAPMTQAGGGLIGVLRDITGEIAKVTASAGVQAGLKALYDTMALLGRTVAPLLGQALAALGPVLAALGPPAQTLIAALGTGLQSIIAALGPVLAAAATAVGALVTALAPLIPVIGTLISGLLPVLTPFLNTMAEVFTALAPVVQQVADNLTTALAPVLAALPGLAEPIARIMGQLALAVLPVLAELLAALGPVLADLGQTFADLLVQAEPLITALGDAFAAALQACAPLIPPLISGITKLASILSGLLASNITDVVIPAIQTMTALLQGDAQGAMTAFGALCTGIVKQIGVQFIQLPATIAAAVGKLAVILGRAALNAMARMDDAIGQGILKLVGLMAALPGKILSAIGNLAGLLFRLGADLISGLIRGVNSAAGALFSRLTSIAGSIGSIFSKVTQTHSPSRVMIEIGHDVMDGLNVGLEEHAEKVYKTVGKIASKLTELVVSGTAGGLVPIGDLGKKLRQSLTKGADDIADVIKAIRGKIADAFKAKSITAGQRDDLLDYLSTTNKKLRDLAKEREKVVDKIKEIQDYAKQVTQSVLNYASIVNIKGDDGAAGPTGGQLVAGLQARLATIREFGGNLKKLAGAGLSKALLRQILDAGIDGGAAIAAELANGPASIITALNTAQTQITKIAKGIGLDGADALFGSGKAMGDAFLKGLKSLEKALVDSMELLVEKLLKALTGGVDKAKAKLTELAETSAKITELAVAATKLEAYTPPKNNNAPTPLVKPPTTPKAPVYQYVAPAQSKTSGTKAVSVNLGGVTVRDRVSVDMLMAASSFAARSASF